jgi:hypothetical protein
VVYQRGKRWRLEREGELLAELVLVDIDMPWYLCEVEPVPDSGFEEVRSATIAAERALAAGDHPEVIRLIGQARGPGLHLCPGDDEEPTDQFFLWFSGDTARLRY